MPGDKGKQGLSLGLKDWLPGRSQEVRQRRWSRWRLSECLSWRDSGLLGSPPLSLLRIDIPLRHTHLLSQTHAHTSLLCPPSLIAHTHTHPCTFSSCTPPHTPAPHSLREGVQIAYSWICLPSCNVVSSRLLLWEPLPAYGCLVLLMDWPCCRSDVSSLWQHVEACVI